MSNPTFAEAELKPMKQRIAAAIEVKMRIGRIRHPVFKHQYFGPLNSPHQFLPIGTKENLRKVSAEAVKGWYQQKVLSAPRVLAIFGDIELEQSHGRWR